MKSKYILITILVISLIIRTIKIVSVEKENKELLATVDTMTSNINMIQAENLFLKEAMKPKTLTYINYKYNYRFIEKETKVYQSPDKEYSQIDLLPENYAVEVEDAVRIDNKDIWLYIKMPKSYDSFNIKGWVRELDTMPITKENQVKIIKDVTVRAGTKVYKMAAFEEIRNMEPSILDEDNTGCISRKKEGYANITCPGGLQFWVEEKYITYPPVD